MAGLTYFKCYPQDFLNGVMGLGPQEGWIYTLIVMQQYDRAEGVPVNVRALAARAMMRPSSVEKAIEALVQLGKIKVEDGRWANPRAKEEISSALLSQQIAISSGRAGGKKSRQKINENKGPAQGTLKGASSYPEAISHKEEDAGEPAATPPKDLGKEFEAAILASCPQLSGAYANAPGLWDLSPVYRWLAAGYDLHLDVIPTVRAYLARPKARTPRNWAFFEGMLAEFREKRLAVPKAVEAPPAYAGNDRIEADGKLRPDADGVVRVVQGRKPGKPRYEPDDPEMFDYWLGALSNHRGQGKPWDMFDLGPAPGNPHCVVPPEALARYGFDVDNPAARSANSARTPNPAHH